MIENESSGAVAYLRTRLNPKRSKGISPLARFALDKCEEAFAHSEWSRFGYWFEIFRDERLRVTGEYKRPHYPTTPRLDPSNGAQT